MRYNLFDYDQKVLLGIISLIILQISLNIFATYRWKIQKKIHPSVSKWWWLLIIWFVNVFGALAFLIFGDISGKEVLNNGSWD